MDFNYKIKTYIQLSVKLANLNLIYLYFNTNDSEHKHINVYRNIELFGVENRKKNQLLLCNKKKKQCYYLYKYNMHVMYV